MILACGGLTVLQELKKEMPNENYIYFGDNARVPYGSKSKETIIKYSKQIANFLISQNVKAIVIACGTASSLAYEELKKNYDIPIINVITPTAKKMKDKNIGVIATSATIKSKAWEKEIKKYNESANVISKACPLFVPIVEENLVDTIIADDTLDYYLKDFLNKDLDSLVLGCTHYPILYSKISNYMSNKINIININKWCQKETYNILKSKDMINASNKCPYIYAYTSDSTEDFKKKAKSFCEIDFDIVKKIKIEAL